MEFSLFFVFGFRKSAAWSWKVQKSPEEGADLLKNPKNHLSNEHSNGTSSFDIAKSTVAIFYSYVNLLEGKAGMRNFINQY